MHTQYFKVLWLKKKSAIAFHGCIYTIYHNAKFYAGINALQTSVAVTHYCMTVKV